MKGFYWMFGNKEFFYKSDKQNITKNVCFAFIDKLAEVKNIPADKVAAIKADERSIKQLQYEISKMTLEQMTTDSGFKWWRIYSKNAQYNYPEDDFTVFVF